MAEELSGLLLDYPQVQLDPEVVTAIQAQARHRVTGGTLGPLTVQQEQQLAAVQSHLTSIHIQQMRQIESQKRLEQSSLLRKRVEAIITESEDRIKWRRFQIIGCKIVVWDSQDESPEKLSEAWKQKTEGYYKVSGYISVPITKDMTKDQIIKAIIKAADGRPIIHLVVGDHGHTNPWKMSGMQFGNDNNWLIGQDLVPLRGNMRHFHFHPGSRITLWGCTLGSQPRAIAS